VVATFNEKLPERWRERVSKNGIGLAEKSVLSRQDSAREHLLMNLRLVEGIDVEAYETRWNASFDRKKIAGLEEEGLVTSANGRLAATPRGRLVLNAIIATLAD
jgi:oxygen-independent coproporphyrinogen-3 oxidase